MTRPLFDINDLCVTVTRRGEEKVLVKDVSLAVDAAQSVGLVGESGSGKSMTIRAAMRLLPSSMTVQGGIEFDGTDVLALGRRDLTTYRARDVALIYQDPRAHINPTRTIAQFVTEGVIHTDLMTLPDATARACELMRSVGISDPDRRMAQFPHELSGGLLQRVMIVAALLPSPRLVFADEPTTALDVTVQSDVMAVLLEQIRDRHAAMLFVTHDLDLAAAVTDRLAVMYAGSIVETGPSEHVYERPLHPYTAGLLQSRPSTTEVRRLRAIPGRPISAYEAGAGCAFAARCAYVTDLCRVERPLPRTIDHRVVACHRTEEISDQLSEDLG